MSGRRNTRKKPRINTGPRIRNITIDNPHDIDYKSAGCAFIHNEFILGGRQWISKKGKEMFSGFGGKKEKEDKTYLETALRETIEELFFNRPPSENSEDAKEVRHLVHGLLEFDFRPQRVYLNTTYKYVLCVFTFKQLEELLAYLKKNDFVSPLYTTIPVNIDELIHDRKLKENISIEISHLNMINIRNKTAKLSRSKENMTNEFLNNIQTLINHAPKNK